MRIDADENEMVGEPIERASAAASLVRQAGELAIGVVERVAEDMHTIPKQVQPQVAVVIKVPGDDAEGRPAPGHLGGRHAQLGEEKREPVADLAVEVEVEKDPPPSRAL